MSPECTIGNSAGYFLTADNPRIAIEHIALVTHKGMLPRKDKTRLITKIIRVGGKWHENDLLLFARVRANNEKMHPPRVM